MLQRKLWVFLCRENPQKSSICSVLGVYKSKQNHSKTNMLNKIPACIKDPILPTSTREQLPWEELCLFPHSSHGDEATLTDLGHICNRGRFIPEPSSLQKSCAHRRFHRCKKPRPLSKLCIFHHQAQVTASGYSLPAQATSSSIIKMTQTKIS